MEQYHWFIWDAMFYYGFIHDNNYTNAYFDFFDRDHSGTIQKEEIKKLIKGLYGNKIEEWKSKGEEFYQEKLQKKIEKFLDEYDVDKDGKITKEELKPRLMKDHLKMTKKEMEEKKLTLEDIKAKSAELKNELLNTEKFKCLIQGKGYNREEVAAAFDEFITKL
ncbi:MAG: EF-hand domain-containing protein [archaeon]|nr:EF-hand domain-containing protein [archaeon]